MNSPATGSSRPNVSPNVGQDNGHAGSATNSEATSKANSETGSDHLRADVIPAAGEVSRHRRHPLEARLAACGDAEQEGGSDCFSRQVRRSFARGAPQYDQEALLQQAMAWRLARLCADLPLPDGPCADLGAGTGLLSRALMRHHHQLARQPPLQLDLCPELLARNPVAATAGNGGGGGDRGDSGDDGGTGSLVWDLNGGLPGSLQNAALLASSFALQWLQQPSGTLRLWCGSLAPGGWLVLAVPTAGCFPQWHRAAERAGVPCTALTLPAAGALLQAAEASGLRLLRGQRLRFSRSRQGGLQTLRHLQRLGAGANRRSPLSPGQLRRLLAQWPACTPLTWEVLLLIGQRRP